MTSPKSGAVARDDSRLAITGMAVRLPGADSIGEYWSNLISGTPCIMRGDRVRPRRPPLVAMNAVYVGSYGQINKPHWFDPDRFGLSRSEALITDPQQRILLEIVDAALDSSAIGARPDATIGIFAGVGPTTHSELLRQTVAADYGLDDTAIDMANGFQYAAGRVAYALGLTGPAINVATACSTGLTGVHLARQSLLNGECDVAVVAVSAVEPARDGYWWVPGGISSSDGVCRPFDREADGTVPADGAAAVVLRPLSSSLEDGDPILAVVSATALNNDGKKSGFASVNPASQRQLLRRCLGNAGLTAEDITYVEAHGTGTKLGDSVEWSALCDVYGSAERILSVGSVKGNIGHTRETAGLASLVKAVLSIQRKTLLPTANFRSLPRTWQASGAKVEILREARPWEPQEPAVRRAGVSAFGLGGTNAHVLLEEAPAPAREAPGKDVPPVITLRSHNTETLDADTARLETAVDTGTAGLAAVAYTSQVKTYRGSYRRVILLPPAQPGAAGAAGAGRLTRLTRRTSAAAPRVAFVFPGLAAEDIWPSSVDIRQWPQLGAELRSLTRVIEDQTGYHVAPAAEEPRRSLGDSLRLLRTRRLQGAADVPDDAARGQLPVRHLRLLCTALGLARALRRCGVLPCAVAGHSLGEIAAAVTAGAVSLEDGILLTARRAECLEESAPGATLVAAAGPAELEPIIDAGTEISAENSPYSTTLSGPYSSIARTQEALASADVACTLVDSRYAFHSRLLDAAGKRLAEMTGDLSFRPPAVPFVLGLTGTWLDPGLTPDSGYWARQVCSKVMFGTALATLGTAADIVIDVGTGVSRSWLAQSEREGHVDCVHILRSSAQANAQWSAPRALAELWLGGVDLDWRGVHGGTIMQKISWPPASLARVDLSVEPMAGSTPDELEASATAPAGLQPAGSSLLGGAAGTMLERLRSIWQRLLPACPAEPGSDFFDFGGDSLLGLRLSLLVSRSVGVAVPHEVIFHDTTLGGMSRSIESWLDRELSQELRSRPRTVALSGIPGNLSVGLERPPVRYATVPAGHLVQQHVVGGSELFELPPGGFRLRTRARILGACGQPSKHHCPDPRYAQAVDNRADGLSVNRSPAGSGRECLGDEFVDRVNDPAALYVHLFDATARAQLLQVTDVLPAAVVLRPPHLQVLSIKSRRQVEDRN
jgi:phthiocerol/phenolphthiocerol synthesis type-I polyketide synthase E